MAFAGLRLSPPIGGSAPGNGQGEGMDVRVEATQKQLPDARKPQPR